MNRLSFVFLLVSAVLFGQYQENLTYGLKVGVLHSKITNLPEMIIGREHNLTQFSLQNRGKYGIEGGVFLNYKFPDSRVAIQPEILFRQSGERVEYHHSITGKQYTLDFNYSYLVIGATYKLYPISGFNLGVGAHYAKILTPNGIEYTSNEYNGMYDTNYRQFYREGIVAKDDFNLSFSLGYEMANSFHFDLKYYLGVGDVIGNRNTSFQFLENTNRNSLFTLSVGYSFHHW